MATVIWIEEKRTVFSIEESCSVLHSDQYYSTQSALEEENSVHNVRRDGTWLWVNSKHRPGIIKDNMFKEWCRKTMCEWQMRVTFWRCSKLPALSSSIRWSLWKVPTIPVIRWSLIVEAFVFGKTQLKGWSLSVDIILTIRNSWCRL